jgi:hypothetical protein
MFFMASKFDPRFFLLPFLEKVGPKFMMLDQLVTNVDGCDRLPLDWALQSWGMDAICDVNDQLGDDMLLYRFNEEKTIEWLKGKVKGTAAVLAKQRYIKGEGNKGGLVADGFNMGTQMEASGLAAPTNISVPVGTPATATGTATAADAADTALAAQLLLDYLSPALADKLVLALGLKAAHFAAAQKVSAQPQKRKADWELELEIEKDAGFGNEYKDTGNAEAGLGGGCAGGSGASNFNKKPSAAGGAKKSTSASSKIKDAPRGVKSISSFFGKK